MSNLLTGADLFDAVYQAMGSPTSIKIPSDEKWLWMIVPEMLEWLNHQTVRVCKWSNGTYLAEIPGVVSEEGARDLPTALARLILRVKELENL